MKAEDRFWAKVDRSGECWLWTATANTAGYGRFWHDGKLGYAHRWSYEHHHRPLLPKEAVDHLCRRPACVNPDHLDAVSQLENNRRAVNGSSARGQVTMTCIRGHLKAASNLYRHGGRYHCMTCRRDESRERHRRHRDVINARRRELYAARKHDKSKEKA